MAHLHSVYDNDTHLKIDSLTREITNTTDKLRIIQFDHNSERFTFELPRYIDGHDMSLCNNTEVHYNNIGTDGEQNKGVYPVDDIAVSPDGETVVICSWLVSANATQLAGSLNFLIRFACLADDGTIDYAWHTEIFSGITVSNGMNNGEAVVTEYADVLEAWKQEVLAVINVNLETSNEAATRAEAAASRAEEAATRAEAAAPSGESISPTAKVEQTADGATITIADKDGTTTATVSNGKDGENGQDGADGTTPHIGDNGNWYIGDTDTGVSASGSSSSVDLSGYYTKTEVDDAITNAITGAIEGSY